MSYIKLQVGCLVVLSYIAFMFFKERKQYNQRLKDTIFDELLGLAILAVIFDGMSAYTVNNLDVVSPIVNTLAHALFLMSVDAVIFCFCVYMLVVTGVFPKSKKGRIALFTPVIINLIIVLVNIGSLEYVKGSTTNYSMGFSAYTCYFMAAVYIIISVFFFAKKFKYIEEHKRISILSYLCVLCVVTLVQMLYPETLITSLAVTVFTLGVYLNLEDPAYKQLATYHGEVVMSFSNLIENRDDSTGGHIKRTSMYVKLIAEELRKAGHYKNILTKDYIENLAKAAPMHDIGKIAVPDAVLKKPGRLTDEEFDIMKEHSANGAKIIKETFSFMGDEDYKQMAYEVAMYHHEKWNGRGYPKRLKENDIPLGARIMAVADVFDAVSEKRVYRDAMPLDKCFEIIKEGKGEHFDPVIAEVFLINRKNVEKIYQDFNM